jgi:hypothetical protein
VKERRINMRKIMLYVFLLLILCFIARGRPVIIFENTVQDFGIMMQNAREDFCFTFSNNGDSILKIIDCKSYCQCTVIEDPLLQEIKPGEMGYIKGVFHAGEEKGEIERMIRVKTNESENAVHYLTIKADVTEVILIEPVNTMVLPDPSGESDHITKEITVTHTHNTPFLLNEIKSKVNFLSARIIGEEAGKKKEMKSEYTIQVTIDRSGIPQFHYYYVAFELTFCMELPGENTRIEKKSLVIIFNDQISL